MVGGEQFVVESTLTQTFYAYDATRPAEVRTMSMKGQSPYFVFRITTEGLTKDTTGDAGVVCRNAGASLFGLEVRGSSKQQTISFKTCEIERRQDALYVAFSSSLVRGGFLDACFYLLPTSPDS